MAAFRHFELANFDFFLSRDNRWNQNSIEIG